MHHFNIYKLLTVLVIMNVTFVQLCSLQICSTYLISFDSHNCPVKYVSVFFILSPLLERLGPREIKRNAQGYTASREAKC